MKVNACKEGCPLSMDVGMREHSCDPCVRLSYGNNIFSDETIYRIDFIFDSKHYFISREGDENFSKGIYYGVLEVLKLLQNKG